MTVPGFGTYEGFYQRTATTYLLNAPTAQMLAGDFSQFLTPAGGQAQLYIWADLAKRQELFAPGAIFDGDRSDPWLELG